MDMSNRVRPQEKSDENQVEKAPSKGFKSLLTGSFLSKENVIGALPFVFFSILFRDLLHRKWLSNSKGGYQFRSNE